MKAYKNVLADNILLQLKDLSVQFKTLEGIVYAVKGINLNLKRGEVLGLVGETGAGKTTTALSILGLLPKQGIIDGKIIFDQKNIIGRKERELRGIRGNQISMVFQDPMSSLNPSYTIIFQIAETVKKHQNISWEKAKKKAVDMLRSVGISEDRADEYPHEFSGGMIQRVMIAIGLICKPRLLILDEPTTALDVTIQAQVLALLQDLKTRFNTSMIFITHDLAIVPILCDSVAVMYSGKIVEMGQIQSIYTNPKHPYTKNLFECIPDVNAPEKEIKAMTGHPPSNKVLSDGCLFYPRCSIKKDDCISEVPQLIEVEPSHQVACLKIE